MAAVPGTTSGGGPPVVQVGGFYPPHLGGLENVMRSVAEGVAATCDVQVITSDCGATGVARRERRGRLRVRRVRGVEIAHTPLAPGFLPRILAVSDRHVVHLHMGHALLPEIVLLAAALRRFPYVAHFHIDADRSGRMGVLLPLYKALLLRPAIRRAACVIALSDKVALDMAREYAIPIERVLVMSNGVAPEFFADQPDAAPEPTRTPEPTGATGATGATAIAGTPGRPLRLLFVGRLTRQKNVPRLLEALGSVRAPVELVVVGDGEDRETLEAQVTQLGLRNARLVGPETGDALARWHRWADVFVLSSDIEGGLPLVVLEAMAGGLPIIATDVAGVSDTFGDAGILAAPNADALAAAIDRMAADPELRAKAGARNRERAESFSWTRRIAVLLELYRQVHPDHDGHLDVAALRRLLTDG
ncbi:glycosyltransferase family 4 protein [Frankia sp. AgPm24]|uniref:glycosyltransferase family 4 protein n=1 Tax=Frankia sp. AgPm24 TaxID=631128 RepID=UPI00200FB93F|nr:glycosyltransferase family 4 protein [Frankia sp. AgPm24]MCK9925045.1 glycosyltransferase family 4 protein [Frankia sp. AgPm24]